MSKCSALTGRGKGLRLSPVSRTPAVRLFHPIRPAAAGLLDAIPRELTEPDAVPACAAYQDFSNNMGNLTNKSCTCLAKRFFSLTIIIALQSSTRFRDLVNARSPTTSRLTAAAPFVK